MVTCPAPAQGHVIDRRHFTEELIVARFQVICNEVMKVYSRVY